MKLLYGAPAESWTDALPMGNGHMGAMAFGGAEGRFELSEACCWSGGAQDEYLAEGAGEAMTMARAALIAGRYTEGEALLERCCGLKQNYGTQLPLGTLWVGVDGVDDGTRSLDLIQGICRDEPGGCVRESFVSGPDKVLVVRLRSEGRDLRGCAVRLTGHAAAEAPLTEGDTITVRGRALESMHSDGRTGAAYVCRAKVVRGERELVVFVSAATDLIETGIDALVNARIEAAAAKGWADLRAAHIADHSAWMNRCTFVLPDGPAAGLPTDERIASWQGGHRDDTGLTALLFQYGRYMLLASSRPDSLLPAALQGAFNDDRACRMEWTDDMHLDINTQLNYFPAEKTGLSETTAPLFRWLRDALAPNGARIARELYGAPGWVAHTVSGARGWAAPGWGGVGWGFAVCGGAWAAAHIWIHYLYTRDEAFLRDNYAVLLGAAEFLHGILMPDPETGELLVVPSYSPENVFIEDGERHSMSAGAAIDTAVARYLFGAAFEAAGILGLGKPEHLRDAQNKLPRPQIGRFGQLMEWHVDFEEAYPDHRHLSHLLALYPFDQIDIERTPELAGAARIALDRRVCAGEGDVMNANWSAALLALYYARLGDGDAAVRYIDHMAAALCQSNLMITHLNGIYELDGNTGYTAAVSEMLMQSAGDVIRVLPAMPAAWPDGQFTGLVAHGGHKVSATWSGGTLDEVAIIAACDARIELKHAVHVLPLQLSANETARIRYSAGRGLTRDS